MRGNVLLLGIIKLRRERKNLIAFSGSLAVCLLLVVLTIHSPNQTQDTSQNDVAVPPAISHPVVLNTVAYAEKVVGAEVILPDASILGSDYKIVGVQIITAPQNDTTSNGITYRNWVLQFVISNAASSAFVNGTTQNTKLYANAITVTEGPSTGYYDSYEAAVSFMSPSPVCATSSTNGSQTCTTPSQSTPYSLVEIRNTYLVVDASVPNAYFSLDGSDRIVQIYAGGLSYQSMLDLAGTMIP
jgi:hypothetical protein